MSEPCLTCNEEYEAMLEIQARIREARRQAKQPIVEKVLESERFVPSWSAAVAVAPSLPALPRPAKNANRQSWVDYVVSTGVTEAELAGKSRDNLAKEYGS